MTSSTVGEFWRWPGRVVGTCLIGRFEPSCSRYMAESIKKFGPVKGLGRGLRRVSRCHPWNPGGYDPP
jgi:putative membrane protein insertion efficiency factor